MEKLSQRASARTMHKIVWTLVGAFSLMAVTYPFAMWRVSQMEKFRGSHVKPMALEGPLENLLGQSPLPEPQGTQ